MKTIRVGYAAPNIGTAPVWTACDIGYFAKRGINVEPILFRGSILTTKALENNEIDLANYAAPAAVQAKLERGAELIVVVGALNRLMQWLVGRPGIASFEALRGGTIGVNEWGEVNHWIAKAILPYIGFKEGKDITLVETGRPTGESWETPRPADALPLHLPEPFAAVTAGWHKLKDMAEWNIPFQLACVTGKRSWIEAHRPEMDEFVAAYVEGLLRFNHDREVGLAVARKWGPKVSEAVQQQNWDFASREFAERPFPTEASIATILRAMTGTIAGAETANPKDFIDASFMEKLDASGKLAELQSAIRGAAKAQA